MIVKKFDLLDTLIKNKWELNNLNLKGEEDIFQIISEDNILYVYIHKECIEISQGENVGPKESPDLFPLNVWELKPIDFENKSIREVAKVFLGIYLTGEYR